MHTLSFKKKKNLSGNTANSTNPRVLRAAVMLISMVPPSHSSCGRSRGDGCGAGSHLGDKSVQQLLSQPHGLKNDYGKNQVHHAIVAVNPHFEKHKEGDRDGPHCEQSWPTETESETINPISILDTENPVFHPGTLPGFPLMFPTIT